MHLVIKNSNLQILSILCCTIYFRTSKHGKTEVSSEAEKCKTFKGFNGYNKIYTNFGQPKRNNIH